MHIVKAQQQVDQGGLARARPADEADLLAGADGQVEPVNDHTRIGALAIGKGHVVKAHLALRHVERFGIGRVDHGVRFGQRVDAVLDGAHALEQGGHLPHHPVSVA
ncbi:hypothetical protein D3C72_2202510 [compost metagenome]